MGTEKTGKLTQIGDERKGQLTKTEEEKTDQLTQTDQVETFLLPGERGLEQILEKILSMNPEVRTQFDYSVASQGTVVKIPRSGMGDIEVIGPKVLLKIIPKAH